MRVEDLKISSRERELVRSYVERLKHDLDGHLEEIILFGSCARGDSNSESDIDLLVIVDERGSSWQEQVSDAAIDVVLEQNAPPIISAKSLDRDFVKQRRSIKSFFMQEVDRDGIRLYP